MRCFCRLGLGLFLLPGLLLGGCGESGDAGQNPVTQRTGEPDYYETGDSNELMDRAIARAQETYRELVEAMASPLPTHGGHAVKKPFPIAGGGQEHIWITDLSWDGQKFTGILGNEPVDTSAVAFGDRVSVTPQELSDWMYVDGNRVVGGYTIRVLQQQSSPEQRQRFLEMTGLDVPPVDF
ncbi:MAG: DUF2314 domain-containing protein [Planctomycetota bacterium]